MTRPSDFQAARDRLAVALDVPDLERAKALARTLAGEVGWLKVGGELFTRAGPEALAVARDAARVFLDTKLHDIPNTVAGAVRAAVHHGVDMLTLHASGGSVMLRAARTAADEAARAAGRRPPWLLGVTVLTSLDAPAVAEVGVEGPLADQVERLAALCQRAGLDGVVCSPAEAERVRGRLGPELRLVVPGIRDPADAADDQARTASCEQAIRAGADVLVVGRPVLRASDPASAARRFVEAIGKALDAAGT